jgi:octaprenyl-diphosphate synthase
MESVDTIRIGTFTESEFVQSNRPTPSASFVSPMSAKLKTGVPDSVDSPTSADEYRLQLKSAIAPIAFELQQVEQMIRRELGSTNATISEMLTYVGDLGGKRLRPCLLLLSSKACGKATEESVRLSVVVEMVHTATLVHDDVLDKALERRHKETVHEKWSVPASILIGDWLFAHAYGLANRGTSTIPGRWIADAAKQVCEGEILQGQSIRRFDISIEDYLKLLEAKTGALCAVSCALGAWSGGGDESACHHLQQFGLKLGTAFQVFDDWLDVWGVEDQAGKTLGTDLSSFKPTLPTLRALECMPKQEAIELVNRLNVGDAAALNLLKSSMMASDASSYTRDFANRLITEAIEELAGLPDSDAKQALVRLAKAATERRG